MFISDFKNSNCLSHRLLQFFIEFILIVNQMTFFSIIRYSTFLNFMSLLITQNFNLNFMILLNFLPVIHLNLLQNFIPLNYFIFKIS
jgi:hypothetical protein